jgi:hypothetical protein
MIIHCPYGHDAPPPRAPISTHSERAYLDQDGCHSHVVTCIYGTNLILVLLCPINEPPTNLCSIRTPVSDRNIVFMQQVIAPMNVSSCLKPCTNKTAGNHHRIRWSDFAVVCTQWSHTALQPRSPAGSYRLVCAYLLTAEPVSK